MPELFPTWLILLSFGMMGACIGSFLNVVIYRVPLGISVNDPARSFCPHCDTPIPWYLNIPVISWFFLRGKSACCRKPISFRYCFVELLTAALFVAIAWKYAASSLPAAILLCLWAALAVVIIFIDAEHMLVFRRQTVFGALCAIGACCFFPFLLPDENVMSAGDALKESLIGGGIGYLLIRLIIELGKLLFGSWKKHFEHAVEWHIQEPQEEHEELRLIIDGTPHDWSLLFHRDSDQARLTGGICRVDGIPRSTDGVIIKPDRIELPDGHVFLLEDISSVSGTLTDIRANREAMGGGDAWIMMMIGCVGGWQAVLFCLFLGSVLGIIQAIVARVGFGKNLPFGPALLTAGFIWIFAGLRLWHAYFSYISGE